MSDGASRFSMQPMAEAVLSGSNVGEMAQPERAGVVVEPRRKGISGLLVATVEFVAGEPFPDLDQFRRAVSFDVMTADEVNMLTARERNKWLKKLVRAEGVVKRVRGVGSFIGELIAESDFERQESESERM